MSLIKQYLIFIVLFSSAESMAQSFTPEAALKLAIQRNPELAAYKARATAEESLVKTKYFLANPRVGIMKEKNMTPDQQAMGDMESWSVSQEIMFPTKYVSMGSAQKAKAKAIKFEADDKFLEIRQKVLSTYYSYYASKKILDLLEAQKETLREISRVAESRRASGKAPQQDEMKAHVEQTLIENELILQKQEINEMRNSLNVLLSRNSDIDFELPKELIKAPVIKFNNESLNSNNSKMVEAKKEMLEMARSEKNLAYQGYLPDFMLSYRKPYGDAAPSNAYAVGIEMTIPLWFFTKQTGESSAASSKYAQAQFELETTRRTIDSEFLSLKSKVESYAKLITIYDTSLIPQAQSALNSSRAAYSAGRVGFQEFLDAERSLYSVRINYFKNLAKLVDAIAALERLIGESVSSLPFEGKI